MLKNIIAYMLTGLLLVGCAGMGSVRQLGETVKEYYTKVKERIDKNEMEFKKAMVRLGELTDDYVQETNALYLSVEKAKLLESMKSPWVTPSETFKKTQISVVLYHLYALIEANEAVIAAKTRERQEAMANVVKAYGQVKALTDKSIVAQELILKYLNQSEAQQVQAFIGQVLIESKALRETLENSENKKLVELAKDVQKAETRLTDTQDRIEIVLSAIEKIGG